MATQLNDWLSIDKISGTGNAEITLTASSYEELVERTTSLKIQGISTNAILTVRQEALVPNITITPSVITTDCLGSSVNIAITTNISLKLVNYPDWVAISKTYIPKGGTTNITITIDKNMGDLRDAVIDIITFVKGDKIREINITQEAINYDDMGYAELIYETDTDGETIRLFGNVYTGTVAPDYVGLFKPSTGGIVKWEGITDIIIDGVRQEWATEDAFFMENKGEHTVRVLFRNNTIEVNAAAGGSGMVGSGFNVIRQYPFENNPNLKRARIPSSLLCNSSLTKLFANCERLESISIGNNSCMVEGFAYNSSKLHTVIYGKDITSIPSNAFYGCTSLSLQIAPNITSIGSYAFKGCTVSGDVLDLRDVEVSKNAFNGSNYLYNETIVGNYSNYEAFQGCGGTLRLDEVASTDPKALKGSHFTKIIFTALPWVDGWDRNAPYLKEVDFLVFGTNNDVDLLPNFTNTNIEKIIVHSIVPYKKKDSTFSAIAQNGGVLCYPQGADYSSWLLDLTNWTTQTFEFNTVTNNNYFWLEYNNNATVFPNNIKWSFDQVNWYEGIVNVAPNIRLYCKSETSDGTFNNGYYKVGGDLSSLGNLTERSYEDFFKNSSIVDASELILPWTTLTDGCFRYMFGNCSQLTKAPILPATTLAPSCYFQMFYSCEKLNYIKMLATDVSAENCLKGWVYKVSSNGTFIKHPDANIPSGVNGIPSGWTVETATE